MLLGDGHGLQDLNADIAVIATVDEQNVISMTMKGTELVKVHIMTACWGPLSMPRCLSSNKSVKESSPLQIMIHNMCFAGSGFLWYSP